MIVTFIFNFDYPNVLCVWDFHNPVFSPFKFSSFLGSKLKTRFITNKKIIILNNYVLIGGFVFIEYLYSHINNNELLFLKLLIMLHNIHFRTLQFLFRQSVHMNGTIINHEFYSHAFPTSYIINKQNRDFSGNVKSKQYPFTI